MESGGRSSNTQQEDTMRAPKSGIVIHEADATTNIPVDGSTNPNPQQTFRRNSDQYMPIANVIRIMRRILPPHAKIADDAKETIQECVTEFISFITNEANEKCHREYRKTITPEDILSAMRTLGFDNYVEPFTVFLNKYRAQEYPERSAMHHMLFLRRGAGVVQHPAGQVANPAPLPPPPTTIGFAPPPLPAPPAIMGRAPPLPPPIYSVDGGDFVELPPRIGDYTMGNQGGGEGSSTRMEFDPYRQFK